MVLPSISTKNEDALKKPNKLLMIDRKKCFFSKTSLSVFKIRYNYTLLSEYSTQKKVARQLITTLGPSANWGTVCKGQCVRRKHLQKPFWYITVLALSSPWHHHFLIHPRCTWHDNFLSPSSSNSGPSLLFFSSFPARVSHLNNAFLRKSSQKDLKKKNAVKLIC